MSETREQPATAGGEHEATPSKATYRLGIVAIGRNEGDRLKRCLASLQREGQPVVYVDSGSTDGSVEHARHVGAEVVELDMSTPFTAARARNAGYQRLLSKFGTLDFVQFVDGDCEMAPQWMATAVATFDEQPDLAIVFGRLRELKPDETIYNRLADMEWDTPIGRVQDCGGIFMIRSGVFRDVEQFNERIIAGEEPELCARIRRQDWKILHLGDDMGWHDAATTHFSQWWKRAIRGGHAFMEGYMHHRGTPESYGGKSVRSNFAWGLILPLFILATAYPTGGYSLILLLAYPALAAKITLYRMRSHANPLRQALLYGLFTTLGKFPGALGQIKFWVNRLSGKQTRIIEYKTAG
ncbi:MAG: glycosyltransferase [Phycisphaeraceae bacterium]